MFIKSLLTIICLIVCVNGCGFRDKTYNHLNTRRRQLIGNRIKTTLEERRVVPDIIDTVPKDIIKVNMFY